MNWVQNVARSQGYVIVTKRSKAITIGFISEIVLGCDRGGISKSKDAATKKINCPFELIGKYLKAHDIWTLRVVRDEHNHEPSMYMEGHPFAMRLSDKESRLVQNLTELNVKLRDILSALKEQNQNNVSSLRTIYNFRHKLGRSQREGRTPIQNVMHILQTKGYDFEYRLNNTTNELEELFFMHPENCGCQLRTCFGLPCAHELAMYVGASLPISLDLIDAFWRKLDLEPSISVEYGDLNFDHHMEKFKEIFNNQSDHGKYCYLRRMEEIADPSKILINEPSVKKNNRGRPKMKRVQHQSQAPHRHSCSDLNREPPRHSSSFIDLKDEPARHSSFFMGSNEEPVGHISLLKEIHSIFHPYITHIQNVRGDGNCGFRSIAVCLGYDEDQWFYIRQQLYDELLSSYDDYARVFVGCDEILNSLSFFTSPAPKEHWMFMPETGILIANRFGVILHFLTNEDSITCFPLWRGPQELQYHRVLTIALVHTNHYVMVQLEGEYPMPPISALWIRNKAPSPIE